MQHEDSVRHFRRSLDRDWAAVFSSTKANAEDNEGVVLPLYPACPVPPALPAGKSLLSSPLSSASLLSSPSPL